MDYLLVVVTNQPDVARGTQTRGVVEAINAHVGAALGISEFRVCYHDDAHDRQGDRGGDEAAQGRVLVHNYFPQPLAA